MSERRLRRFFTGTPIPQAGDKATLAPSETEHLRKIIRLKEGDRCLVTDGSGLEGEAVIESFSAAGEAVLRIEDRRPVDAFENTLSVTVYPALIQKGKVDDLVRQMQELGAAGFFPVETERTIVKMDSQAKAKAVQRWEKIAREAAKQSGSLSILKMSEPVSLKEALKKVPSGEIKVVFHPGSEAASFSAWIQSFQRGARLHLFLGPEGGFSEKEAALFRDYDFKQVGLGPTLLKADTALLGVVSALKFLFHD
jgi:16S rRNA (uracil1498-N3)-methyltransferase